MASDHPFQLLFETLGRVPAAHAEAVNRQAYQILSEALSVPLEKSGRCIMLRAPRAGHGKTHLLSRIQHQLGASYEFIPLHAAYGSQIDAASVIDDTLRRLVRQLPASGGLTVLDLVTRRLFASALQPLVASGEVPCQDREGALTSLRSRPIETFDFHHPNAATAHWARENFEVLGQRLSLELAQRVDLPVSDVALWVEALFRFAAAPLDNSSRVRTLTETVRVTGGEAMERLEALLGLLTLLMRVVLVADDLEGFSTDETSALKLAAFLGALRQSVERLDVILSLNQDIWQSAFLPRLSGGLADRLSEVVVELEPLTKAEMAALLDSRVPGLGGRVLEHIDVGTSGTHARGLMRAAGMAWLKATAMDSLPETATAPAVSPLNVVDEGLPPITAIPPEPTISQEKVEPAPAPVSEERPAVEIPAFAFLPEIEIPAEEPAPQWPSPDYKPSAPASSPPLEEWLLEQPAAAPFYPQIDAPFQPETERFTMEPPVTAFASTDWQQTDPVVAQPQPQEPFISPPAAPAELDSPFQITSDPELAEDFPTPSFTPASWPKSPPVESPSSGMYQEFASSTHGMEPAPALPSSPHPVTPPPVPASEVPPPSSAADTDRVENLLRQFRERYGRGSL